MNSNIVPIIVLSFLVALGTAAVWLSIAILRRGRLYRRLSPEGRPRQWVLFFVLTLFAIFVVWFPVWMIWPHALVSRFLTGAFGIAFGVVGLTFRWLSGFVDAYVKRKGWPLR